MLPDSWTLKIDGGLFSLGFFPGIAVGAIAMLVFLWGTSRLKRTNDVIEKKDPPPTP